MNVAFWLGAKSFNSRIMLIREELIMKKRFVAICAVIFWLMAACATAPVKDINTYSAADPKAKFSGYKTYAWLATAQIVNDTSGKWEPPAFDADSEVKFIIDRELRKRGLMENSDE